jgi:uncharacterized membrane protein
MFQKMKNKRLSSIKSFLTKRRFIEILSALIVIGAITIITTIVTPFHPISDKGLFSDDSTNPSTFYRAKVIESHQDSLKVSVIDGDRKGQITDILYNRSPKAEKPKPDSVVIITDSNTLNTFSFVDTFRIPALIILLALFVILVLFVGRRRGATSLIGLATSVIVVGWFIIPLIIAGASAFWVCIAGAYIIAFSSLIIAHGRKTRTYVSLACVSILLLIVAIASQIAVSLLGLSGINDETTSYISSTLPNLDISGILAGGIIIASLGVLDDIVTAQVATVDELSKANHKLSVKELYSRAASVGGEHIASLVNTLALVYVGAALPVIISLSSYAQNFIMLLNSEYIVTEIVRTIIASMGLVLAVPVSTYIASRVFNKKIRALQRSQKPAQGS